MTTILPATLSPRELRQFIRVRGFRAPTSGLAVGFVQANLVILPANLAGDFLRYCQRNPKPCPVLAVSEPGEVQLPSLAADLDIRFDLPCYRVWQKGVLVEEPLDIASYWRDDLVSFAIGCSFSFEQALVDAGISLHHWREGRNVAMYRTNIQTVPAGVFGGPMVVSLRSLSATDAIRAIQICSRFPSVHGAPIHIGDPALIGIGDLMKPDYGDTPTCLPGELPVFWACGVTPQAVIAEAKPDFCITHAPGCMLVTDLLNHQLSSF